MNSSSYPQPLLHRLEWSNRHFRSPHSEACFAPGSCFSITPTYIHKQEALVTSLVNCSVRQESRITYQESSTLFVICPIDALVTAQQWPTLLRSLRLVFLVCVLPCDVRETCVGYMNHTSDYKGRFKYHAMSRHAMSRHVTPHHVNNNFLAKTFLAVVLRYKIDDANIRDPRYKLLRFEPLYYHNYSNYCQRAS